MSYGEIEKSLIALLESSVLAVLSELGLQTPLPREIKIELERGARQSRDVHERLRLCVALARSEGMSPE